MNLKISKILVVILLLAMLLPSACKTYEYFNIEVLEPAGLYFAPEIKSVVVAHNIFRDENDSLGMPYRIFDELGYDTVFLDTAFARAAITNLAGMLNFTERFHAITIDSLGRAFPVNTEDFTRNDVNFMRKLCEENSADAFIFLIAMEHSNNYDVFMSNSGGYYGEFEIIINSKWLFINPFISKLIDKKSFIDTIYYQVEPINLDKNNNGHEARKEALFLAASSSGNTYGARVSPHLVETSRMVFIKGDKNIKAGYKQAQLGNWKNAAFFWRKALSSPENKIVAQACFNLALANEMEGLLEPALDWAKGSYRYFPDTLNATYISILKTRIRQQDELLLQMDTIN
jgi:hypothetical protein